MKDAAKSVERQASANGAGLSSGDSAANGFGFSSPHRSPFPFGHTERHVSSDAQIELEMWEGPISKRERLSEATPRALREALSCLDGNRTDCVWIEIEDVGALSIGGGPSGFVVLSFPSDGSSSHVVTGEDDGSTVELQEDPSEGKDSTKIGR